MFMPALNADTVRLYALSRTDCALLRTVFKTEARLQSGPVRNSPAFYLTDPLVLLRCWLPY